MNLETQQIKDLIRQIAQAKADAYVQEMVTDLMGLTSQPTTTATRTRKAFRAKTKTSKAKTNKTKTNKNDNPKTTKMSLTTQGANRILKFVTAKPGITGMELKPAVDLTQSVYFRAIKSLKEDGRILQKGKKRAAAYFPK